MTKRLCIRDTGSDRKVKPRVMDVVIIDGRILLAVKNTKGEVQIPLADVIRQIEQAAGLQQELR